MHVLLYCSGSAGDILPFVRIGGSLVQRGHSATLVTHAGYEALAEKTGLGYAPIDSPRQYAEFLSNVSALNTPGGIGRFLKDFSLPLAEATVRALESNIESDSLLVSCPTFDVPARLTAERACLPLTWLFIAPVQVASWNLRSKIRLAMFRDLLGEPIGKLRMKLEMPSITDWESWLGYSNSSIGQWPRWFAEPTETWLPGVKPIGFLADGKAERVQLEPEVQQFLADNPAPALITGGTGDYLGESFFSAGLRSARQNKVPAIVVTRYPDRVPPAGSDVLITEKAPFGLLMPQCRCVIHHGGLGTLGAAAGAGIPQLILAFGADRPDNGKRASELGIGQMVEMRNWKTEQPTLLLQELLTSQSTRSGCEEIRKLTYEEQVGFPGVAELEAFGKHGIQK